MKAFIPTPLQAFAVGKETVKLGCATIAAALNELTHSSPHLHKLLFTPECKLRAFVNIYLNDKNLRYLPQNDATVVSATGTLSIIPSIAGGSLPCLLIFTTALE